MVPMYRQKKGKDKIDGYDVYLSAPIKYGKGWTYLYIDSLYANGPTITKFLLSSNNLSKRNQKLFFEVIRTLRFER